MLISVISTKDSVQKNVLYFSNRMKSWQLRLFNKKNVFKLRLERKQEKLIHHMQERLLG